MSQPKLLLPLAGRPLISHTIEAWKEGGAGAIVVVVRADDAPLAAAVESLGMPNVELVRPPFAPPDMKASVRAALAHISQRYAPATGDSFLVAPADMPGLSPAIISKLCGEHTRQPGSILVPTLAGRRGHPVLYPWELRDAVMALAAEEGLNALADRHPVVEIACDAMESDGKRPFADIDTPDQYRAAGGEYEAGQKNPRTEDPKNQR
jgi:molybdenum cofactor cytidylyltransferase